MPSSTYLNGSESNCVAAIGVMCFSVHGSGCAPFLCLGGSIMDLNYFKDTLFDIINESDALEAELLDIRCDDQNDTMTVNMKDGTSFMIHVSRL